MGESITVAVREGGTGKTATSIALAQFAHRTGLFVALVDLAPQAHATGRVANSNELTEHFDLVVDTPPTLGFGMLAPLHGSGFALSPIHPGAHCATGVKAVYEKTAEIWAGPSRALKLLGLLMTRVEGEDTTHPSVLASIKRSLVRQVLAHEIEERTAIRRTRLTHKPMWVDARSGADRITKQAVMTAMCDLLARRDSGFEAQVMA